MNISKILQKENRSSYGERYTEILTYICCI